MEEIHMNKLVSESRKSTMTQEVNNEVSKRIQEGISCREKLICEAWGRGRCDGYGFCPSLHSEK